MHPPWRTLSFSLKSSLANPNAGVPPGIISNPKNPNPQPQSSTLTGLSILLPKILWFQSYLQYMLLHLAVTMSHDPFFCNSSSSLISITLNISFISSISINSCFSLCFKFSTNFSYFFLISTSSKSS